MRVARPTGILKMVGLARGSAPPYLLDKGYEATKPTCASLKPARSSILR
jgi:hypothetical protein